MKAGERAGREQSSNTEPGDGDADRGRRRSTHWRGGTVAVVAVTVLLVLSSTVAGVPLAGGEGGNSGDGDGLLGMFAALWDGVVGVQADVKPINSCGVVIEEPGTYVLADDVVETPPRDDPICIEITASDVVLDGQGHLLSPVPGRQVAWETIGVSVNGTTARLTNVTVRRVDVAGFGNVAGGIRLENVSGGTVEDVYMEPGPGGTGGPPGIELLDSPNTTLREIDINDRGPGIVVGPGSNDVTVADLVVSNFFGDGIVIRSNRTTVAGARFAQFGATGVAIAPTAGDVTLTDVVLESDQSGIGVPSVSTPGDDDRQAVVTIRDTRFEDSNIGIDATGLDATWNLTNATVENTRVGIVTGTNGVWTIRESRFAENDVGVELGREAENVTFSDARFVDNSVGIDARRTTTPWTVSDARFIDNTVGIDARGTATAWTVESTTVTGGETGVWALRSTGSWTVRNATVGNVTGAAVDASESTGRWAVRDATLTGNGVGIHADGSTGQWIANRIRITDGAIGVSTEGSTGVWQLLNTEVENSSDVGIVADDTVGPWYVLGGAITDNRLGVRADNVTGEGRVGLSNVVSNMNDTEGGVVALTTRGSVNVTRNWWGQPAGPTPGQCTGAVNCSNPLDAPSTVFVPELSVGFAATNATADSGLELLFDGTPAGPDDFVTRYAWTFGDGGEATGETVVHAYDAVGAYPVTYAVAGRFGRVLSETQTVAATKVPGEPVIAEIDSNIGGPIVERVDVRGTYTVQVVTSNSAPVRNVTLSYEGNEIEATRLGTSDRWRGEVRFGERRGEDGDTEIRVVARTDVGADEEVIHVDVITFPKWLLLLLDIGSVNYNPVTGQVDIGKQVPDPPIDFEAGLDVPITGGKQKFKADISTGVRFSLPEASARPFSDGVLAATIAQRDAEGRVNASGLIRARPVPGPDPGTVWTTENMQTGVSVKMEAVSQKWKLGKIKRSPTAEIGVGPQFGLVLHQVTRDDDLVVVSSRLEPSIFADGKLMWAYGEFSIGGIVTGQMGGFFFIPSESGNPALFASIEFKGVISFWVFEESVSAGPLTARTGSSSNAAAPFAVDTPTVVSADGWRIRDATGPGPLSDPAVATAAGLDATAGIRSLNGASAATAAEIPRLLVRTGAVSSEPGTVTMDGVDDESPSVAATPGGYTVVWTRPSPADLATNGPRTAGDDVYVSRFDPVQGEWSAPEPLVADGLSDADPDIAVAPNGEHLVAWTVIDAPLGELGSPEEALPHTEIAAVTGDGTSWSAPTRLTDDDSPDFSPILATGTDEALVAWETDGDGNASTNNDRGVRFVTVAADGSRGPTETIDAAQAPAVSTRPDGTFTLAYFAPEDPDTEDRNGTVVLGRVDGGTFTTEAAYGTTEFRELSVAGDAIVWVDQPANASVLTYVSEPGAPPAPVETRRPTWDLRNVNLVTDGAVEVLTFSGNAPNDDAENEQVYLVNRGDGWIFDRTIAGSPETPLSFWQASTAGGDEGFVTTFLTTVVDESTGLASTNDLWYVSHDFRPDLAVTAAVADPNATVEVGDPVTVNYTVENLGDVDVAGDYTVTVSNGAGPVATRTYSGPLPAGEAVTDALDATLDGTGTLVVSVASTAAGINTELSAENNGAVVTVLQPDLTVTDVTERRFGDVLVVNATLTNVGPIAAGPTTYRFESGDAEMGNGTVDALPPGESRNVTVVAAATDVDTSVTSVARVDTADAVAESDETNNAYAVRLLQPDLVLNAAGVRYAEGTCGLVADVAVGNRGTGDGEVTLRVEHEGDGTVLGSRTAPVPPATRTGTTAFTRVVVPLTGAVANETVRLVADTDFDAQPGDNSAIDRVVVGESAINAAPLARVVGPTADPVVGQAVEFDGSRSCDPNGAVVDYEWDVGGDGSTDAAGAVANLTFDTAGTATVVLRVTDDVGATSETSETVTVLPQAGATIRSSDTDIAVMGEESAVQLSTDATDVASYRTTLRFDSGVVEVVDVAGGLGGDVETDVRNDRGYVTVGETAPTGRDRPTLATVTFRAITGEASETAVRFDRAGTSMRDTSGASIPLNEYVDGRVTVAAQTEPTPTPMPTPTLTPEDDGDDDRGPGPTLTPTPTPTLTATQTPTTVPTPASTATPTPTTVPTATPTAEPTTPDVNESTPFGPPGFAVAMGAVVLLGLALFFLLRRK
ncbi:PKD domain-containing protein [Salinigranum halophilum]|uniref:PKD domain-containing protein n=1 Tax=Salinigranum halophilum TaxID=2565931 RepID=UPI0010A7BA1B|nr:PKD domain-containing protein [Salinigranum halophilum]